MEQGAAAGSALVTPGNTCFCLIASKHSPHASMLFLQDRLILACRVSSEIGCVEGKSGNSPAPPPAGPTKTHLQSVEDMLRHLKQNKLTEGRPIKPQAQRSSTSCDNVCLVGENSGRIKWIQPSGMQVLAYSFGLPTLSWAASQHLALQHALTAFTCRKAYRL